MCFSLKSNISPLEGVVPGSRFVAFPLQGPRFICDEDNFCSNQRRMYVKKPAGDVTRFAWGRMNRRDCGV
jgi:hypothetical protein